MNLQIFLDKILNCYNRYYNTTKENIPSVFDAKAEFSLKQEHYMFTKSAKLSEIYSNETVFFKSCENLVIEDLEEFVKTAWECGLEKVTPCNGHKNSDVALVIVSQKLDKEICKKIKKIKLSKSYKFGFYGFSNFKLCVYDIEKIKCFYNYFGKDMAKLCLRCKR